MAMSVQEYFFTCLGEECSEVAQEVAKVMRFGLDDWYPEGGASNKQRLINEVIDVMATIETLVDRNMIDFPDDLETRIQAKKAKLERYLGYSRERGRVEGD